LRKVIETLQATWYNTTAIAMRIEMIAGKHESPLMLSARYNHNVTPSCKEQQFDLHINRAI
jgi:hypothetical protein